MSDKKEVSLFRKKLTFALLYFTEGAPIGLLWYALPTLFREQGLTVKVITQYASMLVLPWSLKILWAPLIDSFKSEKFTYRGWMILSQVMMGITLIPLLFLDLKYDFRLICKLLLVHAFFSSIQDIAIDSLAISVTNPDDRGRVNGWMQMGQFLGQAAFGGGALLMLKHLAFNHVVGLLIICIFILGYLAANSDTLKNPPKKIKKHSFKAFAKNFKSAFFNLNMAMGLLFALTVVSAEKSFTGMIGPYLIDKGLALGTIGTFLAFPAMILQILGALFGGYFADQLGKKTILTMSMVFLVGSISAIMSVVPNHLMIQALCFVFFIIGVMTSTTYSLFMNMTSPAVAATQFSAFMGMVNLCESYSLWLVGRMAPEHNYNGAFIITCAVSVISLIFLKFLTEVRAEHHEMLGGDIGPLED